MRKIFITMLILAFAFALTACSGNDSGSGTSSDEPNTEDNSGDNGKDSSDDSSADKDSDQDQNNDESSDEDMSKKMDDLDYTEFEFEVEFPNVSDEYELELKKRDDGSIKAKLDDTINDKKKRDSEAFDYLYPKIKGLKIDKDTSKKEAIKQSLDAFDLPSDYTDVELEITFKDGTSKEFNVKE